MADASISRHVLSAAHNARVNVSPRGTDALAVIDERTVAYLDRTGARAVASAALVLKGRDDVVAVPGTISEHLEDVINSLRIVFAADESIRTGEVVRL